MDAAEIVFQKLIETGGRLDLSDNSDPKDIYDALGMSKKTFKKAIGTLFRAGKIALQPGFIQLTGRGIIYRRPNLRGRCINLLEAAALLGEIAFLCAEEKTALIAGASGLVGATCCACCCNAPNMAR